MADKCPKCGAVRLLATVAWDKYECDTRVFVDGPVVCGSPCYDNQLAQRDSRIVELEAKLAAAARLAQDSAEAAGEMAEGMIHCQICQGTGWWTIPDGDNREIQCPVCEGNRFIPDRRRPTANDRAVERILDAVDHARAVGLLISPEFLEDIIREEAAND